MLKNYLVTALRSLRRRKAYAGINVVGLALGIACCLLIGLYLRDALSYDRFLERGEDTYRVATDWRWGDEVQRLAWAPGPLGPLMEASLPEVDAATRLARGDAKVLIARGQDRAYETGLVYADPNLFDFFGLPIRSGEPATDLARPHTLMLSASTAARYFGEADPTGQQLEVDKTPYEVVGVFEDLPQNTHLRFELVASRASQYAEGLDPDDWMHGGAFTYVRLARGTHPDAVEAGLVGLVRLHDRDAPAALAQATDRLSLTPVTDIHLFAREASELVPQGDIRYVLLFTALAVMILVVACINYANLATAQAVRRAAEVGVRKALGASRGQLARQFLGESALLCTLAVLLAVVLAEIALPFFNAHLDSALAIPWASPTLLGALALLMGTVTLLAGGYPALVLARFEPDRALRGRGVRAGAGLLRRGLIVFQLAASVGLIASALVIQQQMDLVQQTRPGFDEERVLLLDTQRDLGERYGALREALLAVPAVEAVTTTDFRPGEPTMITFFPASAAEGLAGDATLELHVYHAGTDVEEVLGLRVLEGRAFVDAIGGDVDRAILLNESAVRLFGWTEPVGKRLDLFRKEYTVVGVVEDFHTRSLHEAIEPLAIFPASASADYVAVRIGGGDLDGALSAVNAVWSRVVPERPLAYSFLDADFDALYRTERRLAALFVACAALAIGIACLGLLGLAALAVAQRTKEVGIRKALGASVASVAVLFLSEYVRLAAVAFVVAAPVAYLAMRRWLADFAYHVDLGVSIFLLAGFLTLTATLAAVGTLALRAALADPVKALRHE